METLKTAFLSGSSKHGNTRRASIDCSCDADRNLRTEQTYDDTRNNCERPWKSSPDGTSEIIASSCECIDITMSSNLHFVLDHNVVTGL